MLNTVMNVLSDSYNLGVHSLVRGVSIELTAYLGNDGGGGARRVCRPHIDLPLGDPLSAVT